MWVHMAQNGICVPPPVSHHCAGATAARGCAPARGPRPPPPPSPPPMGGAPPPVAEWSPEHPSTLCARCAVRDGGNVETTASGLDVRPVQQEATPSHGGERGRRLATARPLHPSRPLATQTTPIRRSQGRDTVAALCLFSGQEGVKTGAWRVKAAWQGRRGGRRDPHDPGRAAGPTCQGRQ